MPAVCTVCCSMEDGEASVRGLLQVDFAEHQVLTPLHHQIPVLIISIRHWCTAGRQWHDHLLLPYWPATTVLARGGVGANVLNETKERFRHWRRLGEALFFTLAAAGPWGRVFPALLASGACLTVCQSYHKQDEARIATTSLKHRSPPSARSATARRPAAAAMSRHVLHGGWGARGHSPVYHAAEARLRARNASRRPGTLARSPKAQGAPGKHPTPLWCQGSWNCLQHWWRGGPNTVAL